MSDHDALAWSVISDALDAPREGRVLVVARTFGCARDLLGLVTAGLAELEELAVAYPSRLAARTADGVMVEAMPATRAAHETRARVLDAVTYERGWDERVRDGELLVRLLANRLRVTSHAGSTSDEDHA